MLVKDHCINVWLKRFIAFLSGKESYLHLVKDHCTHIW